MSLEVHGKIGTMPSSVFRIKSKQNLPRTEDVIFIREYPYYPRQKWDRVKVDKIDVINGHYFFFVRRL